MNNFIKFQKNITFSILLIILLIITSIVPINATTSELDETSKSNGDIVFNFNKEINKEKSTVEITLDALPNNEYIEMDLITNPDGENSKSYIAAKNGEYTFTINYFKTIFEIIPKPDIDFDNDQPIPDTSSNILSVSAVNGNISMFELEPPACNPDEIVITTKLNMSVLAVVTVTELDDSINQINTNKETKEISVKICGFDNIPKSGSGLTLEEAVQNSGFNPTSVSTSTAVQYNIYENISSINVISGVLKQDDLIISSEISGSSEISKTNNSHDNFANMAVRFPKLTSFEVSTQAYFENNTIPDKAFQNHKSISTITINSPIESSDGSTNTFKIGDKIGFTFDGCENLSYVSIPNASSLGNFTFSNCVSLKEIDLPNAVSASESLFQNCSSLSHIYMAKTKELVGNGQFEGCSSLTYVYLPELNYISTDNNTMFEGCISLQNITLSPNILDDLKSSTFADSSSLHDINLIVANCEQSDITDIDNFISVGESKGDGKYKSCFLYKINTLHNNLFDVISSDDGTTKEGNQIESGTEMIVKLTGERLPNFKIGIFDKNNQLVGNLIATEGNSSAQQAKITLFLPQNPQAQRSVFTLKATADNGNSWYNTGCQNIGTQDNPIYLGYTDFASKITVVSEASIIEKIPDTSVADTNSDEAKKDLTVANTNTIGGTNSEIPPKTDANSDLKQDSETSDVNKNNKQESKPVSTITKDNSNEIATEKDSSFNYIKIIILAICTLLIGILLFKLIKKFKSKKI